MSRYQVIVVGGGMVGAAVALGLAKRDFNIALLEAGHPPSDWPDNWETRVSAITRASQKLLTDLGAWQRMPPERVTPYRHMCVWNAPSSEGIRFNAAELSEPDLGHIIENSVIQKSLWDELADHPNIDLHYPAEITALSMDQKISRVQLADGDELEAELLIGADGANSLVCTLADIEVNGAPYEQSALVATVRPELGHQETAWQRFLPTGPLALLPIGPDACSIVWSTSPSEAERLQNLSAGEFNDEITHATEGRLGYISLDTDLKAFPLRHQHATAYVLNGLALVGDAAHVIHPLAGQGVNLGFADVKALIETLAEARDRSQPLGDIRTLRPYERQRKGENQMVENLMTGFKQFFGNANPLLGQVRNLGLRTVDNLGPLKNLIAKAALD